MKKIFKLVSILIWSFSLITNSFHSTLDITAVEGTLFHRQSIHGITNIVDGTNGVAMADFNRDGWMDIFTTNSPSRLKGKKESSTVRMFLNQGNGTYELHECRFMSENQLTFRRSRKSANTKLG